MSESDYQAIRRELPRRSKVWEAISDLDYSPPDISNVVRACRESGYSWKELDRIARYEVAPAIWFSWDYFFPKDGVSFDMFVEWIGSTSVSSNLSDAAATHLGSSSWGVS